MSLNNIFYIEFKTNEMPGMIVATRIEIKKEIITDKNKTFAINLCDHPLYKHLVNYVKMNPIKDDNV